MNSKTKLQEIPLDAEAIYLTRPISKSKLEKIISKRKKLQKIAMSKSTFLLLSESAKEFLSKSKLSIEIHSARGRPIGIPLEKLKEALEMRADGFSLRKIEKTLRIPKSTLHYFLKNAKRLKFRKGSKIISVFSENTRKNNK